MSKSIRQLQAEKEKLIKQIDIDECGGWGKKSPLREDLHKTDVAIVLRIYNIIDRAMRSMDDAIENWKGTHFEQEARKNSRVYFRHIVTPAVERKYGKDW